MFVPTPDLISRFRRDIEAVVEQPLNREAKLLIAISGGPDSLALLLLAHAAYGPSVHAATVDHGLRAANADEARFVAQLCAARRIPHVTLIGADHLPVQTASLQARARQLRYRLLGEHALHTGCRWIATGHHMDDQAETLLMRIARGSGLPGLVSIRSRRREARGAEDAIKVIRPLLGWTRHRLRTVVDAAGINPVDDPSNRSPDHDRTHFRALLGATPLLSAERLAASASHLGDCEDALSWIEEREWDARHAVEDRAWRIRAEGLPRELRRRLTLRAIDAVRAGSGVNGDWRRDGLGRLLDLLDAGRTATLAGVKCRGGPVWRFEPAPPRRGMTE